MIGGRYEVAIVQPEKDNEAMSLASISFALMFLSTILLTLIFYLVEEDIFLQNNLDKKIFLFIPLMSLLIGVFNILNIINTRFQNYKSISFAKILRALFQNLIPIILSFFKVSTLNILVGYLGGFLATYITLIKKNFFDKNILSDISKKISC